MSAAAGPPMSERELLRWVYLQTREALRIEAHASAARWATETSGVAHNLELFG